MIERISSRADFGHFGGSAQRIRRGPITLAVAARAAGDPAAVAYAISRRVGPAVVRNRLRRQLRAAARQIDRTRPLPAGRYLVVVHPSARGQDYGSLHRSLDSAFQAAAQDGSGPRR